MFWHTKEMHKDFKYSLAEILVTWVTQTNSTMQSAKGTWPHI